MKSSRFIFQITIFFLSLSILLTGCHSFYEIPKEEYENIDQMDDIKIVYKNRKEFVVEKNDTTNVKIVGDSMVVDQGNDKKFIGMSEVEKIRESRFDIGGTITISIIAFTFYLIFRS
jgi:fibrillarin-like rRNA methylase